MGSGLLMTANSASAECSIRALYLKRSNSLTGKQNIWQEFVKVSKRLTPEYLQSVNTNISTDENYPEDNMISSTLATN